MAILYAFWSDDCITHSKEFNFTNPEFLGILAEGFSQVSVGRCSLEDVQELLRCHLHRAAPELFPWEKEVSVHCMLNHLLKSNVPIISSKIFCPNFHPINNNSHITVNNCHITITDNHSNSVQDFVDHFQS